MRIISSDHFLIHDEEIQKESPVQLTVSWEWENQNQLGEERGEVAVQGKRGARVLVGEEVRSCHIPLY